MIIAVTADGFSQNFQLLWEGGGLWDHVMAWGTVPAWPLNADILDCHDRFS